MVTMKHISFVLIGLLLVSPALACGGRDIILSDNPAEEGITSTYSEPHRMNFHYDAEGNLLMKKSDVTISKNAADKIIEQYLDEKYSDWESYAFESFDLEHARPVYMYSAHAPDVAISNHIGSPQFVTDHLHLHVDVITGELFDVGCGGGPGMVLATVPFATEETNDWSDIMPHGRTYFYTDLVIPDGSVPTIDGVYTEEEWDDALVADFHLGTTDDSYIQYGCGGPGKRVSTGKTSIEHVETKMKVANGVLYVAVEAPPADWIGIMFKDFAHHGMIGDFGDVKLLSNGEVHDYFLSSNPKSDDPVMKQGQHGCFSYGKLVQDKESNILDAAAQGNVYEFAIPLDNEDAGDTHWQENGAYQVAVLVGDGPVVLSKDARISGQETVRLGTQEEYAYVKTRARGTHSHTGHDHAAEEPWSLWSWFRGLF